MSAFTPTLLSIDEQQQQLQDRVKKLEQERLSAGLELAGTESILTAPERVSALAQDIANHRYVVDTLDAKLAVYRDALAGLAE